jgi:hypothetical protein
MPIRHGIYYVDTPPECHVNYYRAIKLLVTASLAAGSSSNKLNNNKKFEAVTYWRLSQRMKRQ